MCHKIYIPFCNYIFISRINVQNLRFYEMQMLEHINIEHYCGEKVK